MYEYVPVPSTWVIKSYNNKPYYLVELSDNSSEYINIQDHFDQYEIISIERVQNPYQYGKYLLYRLQKNSPSEMTYYMPLANSSQLDVALRYNCDYRRLNKTTETFFTTVSSAVCASSYNKLIVLQGLCGYYNHDSGRYPKYVVTFERDN